MIEGSDDIYYGSIGDINSTSTNDIKTLIKNLGGDEKTYYMIENAFAFTASALCPIGKASIAKELTFKSGAQILVREGVSDFTAGKVSDFVYNKTGNRVLSMAAGMASSAGTSKAFDYGDVALGWAKNKVKSGSTSINPNEIRYSQSSVNGSNDIIQSMKANGWQGDPIDVVEMPDGIYTTIDNTRVVSAREAGINVEANVHGYNDPLPSEYIERFTTKKGVPKTWGEAIELRVGKQKASFRNGNPYGKLEMETVK